MASKVRGLAGQIAKTKFEHLQPAQIKRLKACLLDSLGVAIAAVEAAPFRALRVHIKDFNPSGPCTLIGQGRCAPDMAAMHNAGLIGYLDFNDAYLCVGEAVHPSENIAAVLAALEYRGGGGKDLLCAIAIGYEIHGMMCDQLHARSAGFNPTLHSAVAAAAGVSKALQLDEERIRSALAIASASGPSLSSSLTGSLSTWVHMTRPSAVRGGVEAAFFAMRGMQGPSEPFEGAHGVEDLFDAKLNMDWERGDFSRIERVSLRKYNADIFAQSALEAIIQLRAKDDLHPDQIEAVRVDTFAAAHRYIGGGNGDDRTDVMNREEAAHSLPFLISAALLDGKIEPGQYRQRFIRCQEMQTMRERVSVHHDPELTARYPDEMCTRITVTDKAGVEHKAVKCDYQGFYSRPMSWDDVVRKFNRVTNEFANEQLRAEIVDTVAMIERSRVDDLTRLLSRIEQQ